MATEARVVAKCPKCAADILSDHILTRCMECDAPLPREVIDVLNGIGAQYRPPASARPPSTASPAPRPVASPQKVASAPAPQAAAKAVRGKSGNRGRRIQVVSHWHYSAENLTASTLDFYSEIERVLAAKKAPVKTERIDWREGGIFSGKRQYLRVTHERYVFDICAAPFGHDFFWSWWLGTKPSLLESLPYIGFVFKYFVKPDTYYSEDTRQMFEETIHRIVLDVVSGVLSVKKMDPLTAAERAVTRRKKGIELSI